jgi:2-polyprenyl-3-methyl-5-hydroxy-6-metoxy-1,4-benzoquinol methylase
MTCKHCCDADQFFDLKGAKKEIKKYKRRGTKSATKRLISYLNGFDVKGKTLLDIGGGIGALQWNHLKEGGKSTTDIDASSGYLEIAKGYAMENSWHEKSNFMQGDFYGDIDQISKHDIVTLDKVICCYPDFKVLLQKSMDHCHEILALSFPIGGPVSKSLSFFAKLWLKLKGSTFHPYIHDHREVEALITSGGFELVRSGISFPWRVRLYQKR